MVAARTRMAAGRLAASSLVLCGWLTGCGGGPDEPSEPAAPPKMAVQGNPPVSGLNGQTQPSAKVGPEAGLNQSFKDATVQEPPEDQRLPDVTKTGKSVGKLYEAVVAEWSKVPFITPEGKKLAYTATITTELGVVTIELWPEIAPNHVRNFVALARAGYYDGLAFDRAVKRQEDNGDTYQALEGGCPVGSGDAQYGSIGYWLRPEFNPKATHEPGTIGAWHGEEVESAACKFYINLTKAEWMDGSFTLFGKITQGLDVVRAIHSRPVRDDVLADQPVEPVIMQRVTISCR